MTPGDLDRSMRPPPSSLPVDGGRVRAKKSKIGFGFGSTYLGSSTREADTKPAILVQDRAFLPSTSTPPQLLRVPRLALLVCVNSLPRGFRYKCMFAIDRRSIDRWILSQAPMLNMGTPDVCFYFVGLTPSCTNTVTGAHSKGTGTLPSPSPNQPSPPASPLSIA